jgi:hypothetical protein
MKYLKKYNESVDNRVSELQEFCNSNLAYLIDDGFQVNCDYNNFTSKDEIYIKFNKVATTSSNIDSEIFKSILFNWDDVKDDYIPFYEVLSNKYDIIEEFLLCGFILVRKITNEDILEDKVNEKIDNTLIHSIIIRIKI